MKAEVIHRTTFTEYKRCAQLQVSSLNQRHPSIAPPLGSEVNAALLGSEDNIAPLGSEVNNIILPSNIFQQLSQIHNNGTEKA